MDGFLLIDKPFGPTSHDVVDVLRRRLGVSRIGHAGTLDPLASGLLICAVGAATRLIEYLAAEDKDYEGTLRLGVETETGDLQGRAVSTPAVDPAIDLPRLRSMASGFLGGSLQTPPVYSAVKVGGVPAHRRVRAGESVELAPRPVRIDRFDITRAALPDVDFAVTCSSGTYIRSLIVDFGRNLGSGATMTALRRTRIGRFRIDSAASLEGWGFAEVPRLLRPPLEMLEHLPSLRVRLAAERKLRTGMPCGAEDLLESSGTVAVGAPARCILEGAGSGGDRLAGIARIESIDPLVFRLGKNLLG